jgi:hypothetical protein
MKEMKIGERIEIECVEEDGNCSDCMFISCCSECDIKCLAKERADGKNVKFKQVETNGSRTIKPSDWTEVTENDYSDVPEKDLLVMDKDGNKGALKYAVGVRWIDVLRFAWGLRTEKYFTHYIPFEEE